MPFADIQIITKNDPSMLIHNLRTDLRLQGDASKIV